MTIASDLVVKLHYDVKTADGEQVDSSRDQEPLSYIHGHDQIVPGLERALAGHVAGDHVSVDLAPTDAYGEYDENLDLGVPLDAFPEEDRESIKPGVMFAAPHPSDEDVEVLFRVVGVEDGTAYVSGNHPMAGQALHFEVDIIEVRKPTAEELAHEHVHGEGCCHD